MNKLEDNNAQSVSRRKFLKIAGLALGGAAAACCGLGYAASQVAPPPPENRVGTPSFSFGKDDPMQKSILVAYATHTGSTVGVAAAIGETLAGRGFAVEVKPVSANPDPAAYDAVILGSAVNGARWLPEAVEYARSRKLALANKPLALFCVHILNLGDDAASRRNRKAYLNEVRSLVSPLEEVFFSGKGIDPQDTSPVLRWIVRTFKIMPEGDCRDWNKIRAWAQTILV